MLNQGVNRTHADTLNMNARASTSETEERIDIHETNGTSVGAGDQRGKSSKSDSTLVIIVIVVVAVVVSASVVAFLTFRYLVEEIDNYEYTEPFEDSYPAESYSAIEVSNVNGYVRIVGHEGATTIDIEGLKKAHSEDDLDDVELRISEDEDVLVLEVIHTVDLFLGEAIDLDISIPSDIVVKAAESVNGEVEISDVESVSRVHATNGDIFLEIIGIEGNVSVSATNGVIDVSILTSLDATIEMETVNGDISHDDVSLSLTVDEPKHVVGVLNSGGHEISIETVNGDIDLHALT